jgi:hypothetical protein
MARQQYEGAYEPPSVAGVGVLMFLPVRTVKCIGLLGLLDRPIVNPFICGGSIASIQHGRGRIRTRNSFMDPPQATHGN